MLQRRRTPRTAFAVICAAAASSLSLASCNNASQTPPLSITSGSPPNGTVGTAYDFVLGASGGEDGLGFSWQASPGSALPPGLGIQCLVLTPPGQGCNQPQAIAGVPTAAGSYKVVVTVGDGGSTPQRVSKTYSITVAP